MSKVQILPLGVGSGTTAILYGEASSSFAIMVNNECRLLVDLGFGVTRSALHYLKTMPTNLYITHNHLDHSGELPVIWQIQAKAGKKLSIWSALEVESKLKNYRLNETYQEGINYDELIDWHTANIAGFTIIDSELKIKIRKSQHSEPCYGFILFYMGKAILSYSGDSGYDTAYFDWLGESPQVIIDARNNGSYDHASFDQIIEFKKRHSSKIYIIHYGRLQDAPNNLEALTPGAVIDL